MTVEKVAPRSDLPSLHYKSTPLQILSMKFIYSCHGEKPFSKGESNSLPRSSSLTSLAAFSPSLLNIWSISCERLAAARSSALIPHPILSLIKNLGEKEREQAVAYFKTIRSNNSLVVFLLTYKSTARAY